jgi:hypothetical protein
MHSIAAQRLPRNLHQHTSSAMETEIRGKLPEIRAEMLRFSQYLLGSLTSHTAHFRHCNYTGAYSCKE